MRRSKAILRGLTGLLLLSMLGVGMLGGAGLSVRAAPDIKPPSVCPDPTIAQWTFDGDTTDPSTGSGVFSFGTGINGPTFAAGEVSSETPAISFTGWTLDVTLDATDFLQFDVNTTSWSGINVGFKYRSTGSGPAILELHYSTDGATFTLFDVPITLNRDSNFHQLNFDLSSLATINDNANVKFKLFAYDADASNGTLRIDNFTVFGYCPPAPLTILISEVAWAGTAANTDHEWIELRNPGSSPVDINGWSIQAADGNPNISLSGTISPGGYFLLERNEDAVADINANIVYDFSNTLSNSGEILILYDDLSNVIDVANSDGGAWPAGNSTLHATMERIGELPDSDSAWFTNDGVMKNGVDADGNPIWGTPKGLNSLTPTVTATITLTPTQTNTPPATDTLTIVINEVAWAGTISSSDDEWIELYNPTNKDVNLTGWNLRSTDGSPNIEAEFDGIILGAGKYLLLERTDDDPTNVDGDIFYTGSLSNSGEILRLYDPNGSLVDSANSNGGLWPAGISSTFSSMQRSVIRADSDFVWVTYDLTKDSGTKAKDASGNDIRGTPGRANTPINVTPTVTPRATVRPGSTAVGGVVLPPIIGISEFLPRPGYDWNNDGVVDVFDEFIEIINAGQIDINLSAYRLDDEEDIGSPPYILPSIVLKPNERAVFYASETGILLSDAGDTVRLLRGSTVVDAYTYNVVRYPDQAWCRIPDRLGYWNDPCFPTPNNPNALTGTLPLPSKPVGYTPPVCLLPDTTPEEFVYAECEVGGDGIWNRQFWDEADEAERRKLDEEQKWETVFE